MHAHLFYFVLVPQMGLLVRRSGAPEPPRSSIVDWVQPVKPLYRCRDWHLGGAPPGSGG